jgi:hypothetical protein
LSPRREVESGIFACRFNHNAELQAADFGKKRKKPTLATDRAEHQWGARNRQGDLLPSDTDVTDSHRGRNMSVGKAFSGKS